MSALVLSSVLVMDTPLCLVLHWKQKGKKTWGLKWLTHPGFSLRILVEGERCNITGEYFKTGSTSEWKLVKGYRTLAKESCIVNGEFSDLPRQINTLSLSHWISHWSCTSWDGNKESKGERPLGKIILVKTLFQKLKSPFQLCNFEPSIRVKLWQATATKD